MRVRNNEELRDSNVGHIFQMILEDGPISRTQISERIGLSPSAVSKITAELHGKGLIRESGRDGVGVGRPSILLEIDPSGGYFLGADLTGQRISLGVMDLSLNPVITKKSDEPMARGDELYLQLLRSLEGLLSTCTQKGMAVLGVGVATPGLVSQEGHVIEADNLGWEGVKLKDQLRRDLGLDVVVVENDTNAAASGEFQYGAVSNIQVQNMMFVSIDTGIGCGLVLEGRLFSGTNGLAGEIGHIAVDPEGPVCACGRRGCLEVLASLPAMVRDYRTQGGTMELVADLDLIEKAAAGDPTAVNVVGTAAKRIGTAIGSQINILNVDTVLLGGRVSHVNDWFLEQVKGAIIAVTLPSFQQNLSVRRSSLGYHAGLVGIASLCLIQLFYP